MAPITILPRCSFSFIFDEVDLCEEIIKPSRKSKTDTTFNIFCHLNSRKLYGYSPSQSSLQPLELKWEGIQLTFIQYTFYLFLPTKRFIDTHNQLLGIKKLLHIDFLSASPEHWTACNVIPLAHNTKENQRLLGVLKGSVGVMIDRRLLSFLLPYFLPR